MVRVFDMFCGGGGSSRGAQLAGAEPVAALDRWELAADTYKLNFPQAAVYETLASQLRPETVVKDVGKIDLILASPECTSHSVAKGNKPRCEESRATAFEVVRFAESLRPRWIVVENVMQMKHWHRFEEFHLQLKAIGYKTKIGILDAQEHGTPQTRRRLFMVGDLSRDPSLPEPRARTRKTVCSILGRGEPSEPWKFSPLTSPQKAQATIERAERAIGVMGLGTPFIMVYYGTDGAGGFQALDRPLRTVTTLDRFAYVRPTASGHEMRMLQPSELAAAMGFPKSHKWNGTRRDRIKLIGNAVCPLVMRDVLKALIQDSS